MVISDIAIRRPVFATVINLVILLMGIVAWQRLQLREYPNIDVPTITVETNWRGASAEIMETQVTKTLEDSISGIEGVDYITSQTRSEKSQITVTFKLNRDPDSAAADVRDRVGRVRGQLPDAVDEPIISKTEADATPIIYLALSSDTASALEVTDVADRVVQDRLQTLSGVANATIFGARTYSMRVWLNPQQLGAFSLTAEDVRQALLAQNIEVPGGRIEGPDREFTVLTETDLRTPEQFGAIILKQGADYLVRLRDVARIELAAADDRIVARYNSRPAVAIGVIKQSTANPLEVSREVAKAVVEINKILPPSINLVVAYDSTVFISTSIKAVYHTIAEALALVAVVIFLFLRSGRASLIPLVTIPISLLGGLVVMYVLGFSLNTLTLLAFVLAIGLVVDDAIVMLENITRYVEEGLSPRQAAFKGSKEIGFAIVAMTLTLAAVYAPIGMAEGRTGKLFTEFALALAGAVLVSGFIALSLTPMLCSRLLKGHQKSGEHHAHVDPSYVRYYRRWLQGALRHRRIVLGTAGFSLLFTLALFLGAGSLVTLASFGHWKPQPQGAGYVSTLIGGLPRDLAPTEDRGFFIGFGMAPEGATIDYVTRYANMLEKIYETIPERRMHFVVAGVPVTNQMLSFVRMQDWGTSGRRPIQAVADSVRGQMFGVPGLMAFPILPPSLGQRATATPVSFIIQTTASWDDLNTMVQQVLGKAYQYPGLINLRSDLQLNKPELRVEMNRDKVADTGTSVATIGNTIETMLGGSEVTRFKKDGEQYDVIVQVDDQLRRQPSDLTDIFVRNSRGEILQLSNLVSVHETVAPRELNHFNKLRSATLTANVAPGYSLAQALQFLSTTVKDMNNPGVSVDYDGNSREFMQASSSIVFVFILALAFIFLVLSAQFESFIDPLVILFSVPLAIFGALLALWLTGNSLNIYSQIGLVTLVGLIAKNGILIVEFANQLQEQGKEKIDAVAEAAVLRIRPILMTTAATVFGAVPLALATGAGAESRQTIGWVIVGGMSIGTLFTLFVVPVVYVLIGQKKSVTEP